MKVQYKEDARNGVLSSAPLIPWYISFHICASLRCVSFIPPETLQRSLIAALWAEADKMLGYHESLGDVTKQ